MKLLHIDSSILGDASASRQLSAELVQAWRQNEDGLDVTYRDLAADAVAHFSAPDPGRRQHPGGAARCRAEA